jgi:sugar phosphate isomerase/epimerase
MPPLRLAFNTNGLAHHRLDDAIDLLADLGYDGVALTPDVQHLDPLRCTPRDVEAVRAQFARRGLACCVQTGARFVLDPLRKHHPTLLDPDPEARGRRLDYLIRCIVLARDLTAESLTFFSGVAPPAVSATELDERLDSACVRLSDEGLVRGVTVALEPEPGMHVSTLADWDRLRARLGATPLRLALDVGHVHCNREGDVAAAVRRHAGELADVQIEDMREGEHLHLPFGEGTLDPAPIVRALDDVGYAGLVGVELSRDSHRAPRVAKESLGRLRRLSS